MPNDLKKGVRKFNIAHLSIVNNYSKCLMCASTALQTSLEHIFFEKKHINISPFSMKTLIARLFLQKLTISPILFGNTLPKSRFNQIKTITAISFWANPVC